MIRLLLGGILFVGCAISSFAQLSLSDKALLRSQRMEQRGLLNATNPCKAAPVANVAHRTLAMVRLANGFSRADLEAEGVNVSAVRGDIALVSIATTDVERVACLPCVGDIRLSRMMRTAMSNARAAAGVDKMHRGEKLDHPYTGKDVVVGIVDVGLDPNHINFRNEDGTSRVGYLCHSYRDESNEDGWSCAQYERDNIWRFTTDTDESFHGTHTMGILAGSYRGPVEAALSQASGSSKVETVDNPYYGVATEADIAAGCGELVDVLIANNIEMILNYRYNCGKPAVISLSFGSNTGSRNSNNMMAAYLDNVAQEAIVVLAAGNDGDTPLALIKELTAIDTEAKSFILPTYQNDLRYGKVFMYSDKPFKMRAVIYDKQNGSEYYQMPVAQGQSELQYYATVAEDETDIVSQQFKNAFSDGYVGVGWNIDECTGQYTTMMDYYTIDNSYANAGGKYVLGFVVEGAPGQRIECYCDGDYTCLSDYDQGGWDDGMTDGTISDMACGNNVLVVGSYNIADVYPALDGVVYSYRGRYAPGKMSTFSSYGTLADGRTLPHVCAPGAVVISSSSRFYTENEANGVGENAICATMTEDDRTNYWSPAMGTSMSTPFVAGSIALWLQADPTLTVADVKGIISKTAVRDDEVLAGNPAQWGAGKFDAYAGLKEVLRNAGITDTRVDESPLMLRRRGDVVSLFLAGAKSLDVAVYNISGAKVFGTSVAGDEFSFSDLFLSKGVYVVNVNGIHSRKITVK